MNPLIRTAMQRSLLLAIALSTACANGAPDADGPRSSADIQDAAATITPDDLFRRIGVLAHDSMRGRDTPSPELEEVARWIAGELESFGLEPAGEEGWLQYYPYPLEGLDPGAARLDIAAGATHSLEYGTEFFARPAGSGGGTDAPSAVGAVWMGDRIMARSDELRDRAAILRLAGAPAQARDGLRFPQETRATIVRALSEAEEAGAAAVVFVLEDGISPREVAGLAETAAAPRRELGGWAASGDRRPAAFFVTRPAATRLFRAGGLDATEQLSRVDVDRPVPLPGVTLRLAAPLRALDEARAPNVVGLLRGSDPELSDTYIVLTAHMDHVGVGSPDATGDSIYNGADDDASGTAALVEIAEAFASLPSPPRRSLLFVAVSGEEKGLLGSRWFADHPTVPAEAMVANLNMDMIGRNAPDSIVVIGQEYSSLGDRVHDVARRNPDLGLTVSEDLWPEQRFFFRSDHFNFARREIPALFFFAGTHEDYHRPSDELDDIDTDKTARVARLVFLLANQVAWSSEPPEWTRDGLAEVRRLTR